MEGLYYLTPSGHPSNHRYLYPSSVQMEQGDRVHLLADPRVHYTLIRGRGGSRERPTVLLESVKEPRTRRQARADEIELS